MNLWEKMAFDIAIFGADVPENSCDNNPGFDHSEDGHYAGHVSLPEPGPEDRVVAYLHLDPNKGWVKALHSEEDRN